MQSLIKLLFVAAIASCECPNFADYAKEPHKPLTPKFKLPFQRPPVECRTLSSNSVETTLTKIKQEINNQELARLWENCFPNTLDTTISYFRDTDYPLSFVVTGDIDAEWIRDSYRQLLPYVHVLKMKNGKNLKDDVLYRLVKGAIAQHVKFILEAPLCNAFQPPPEATRKNKRYMNNHQVHPKPPPYSTFECKYELDTFASFLGLSNEFYLATNELEFMTKKWQSAVDLTLRYLVALSNGTFDDNNQLNKFLYTFTQSTNRGSETQWNDGIGHPTKFTGLVRSFFRPSDDTTVFQFNTAANAQLVVELNQLLSYHEHSLAKQLVKQIVSGIEEHCIVDHKQFGKVYAYEVDGYGSQLFMDDANIPSLLALPVMKFVSLDNKVYKNTRKMVLSTEGNPYYVRGALFEGIGGPHANIRNAWPMSLITAIRTTNNVKEIKELLRKIIEVSKYGLINESINVDTGEYTRPWFAWANSEFAMAILDLHDRGLLQKVSKNLF